MTEPVSPQPAINVLHGPILLPVGEQRILCDDNPRDGMDAALLQ